MKTGLCLTVSQSLASSGITCVAPAKNVLSLLCVNEVFKKIAPAHASSRLSLTNLKRSKLWPCLLSNRRVSDYHVRYFNHGLYRPCFMMMFHENL